MAATELTPKKQQAVETPWVNRITGYGIVDPESLLANPSNWRIHPKPQQDALGGVLAEVGIVQNIIVNRRTSEQWGQQDRGVETLVDGHLRVGLALSRHEPLLPVTYVDLTPAEEALILATIDPLSAMAATDKEQLEALLREVESGDAAVIAMLEDLAIREHLAIGDIVDDPMGEWQGMPEYEHEDQTSVRDLIVHFKTHEDVAGFARVIKQKIGENIKYIWYPEAEIGRYADKSYK